MTALGRTEVRRGVLLFAFRLLQGFDDAVMLDKHSNTWTVIEQRTHVVDQLTCLTTDMLGRGDCDTSAYDFTSIERIAR